LCSISGAHVNVLLPYSEMRATNIEGTRTALRLSADAGAALHFVSTNAVFPWENIEADGACKQPTL
jgi:thioester reductase-like protein